MKSSVLIISLIGFLCAMPVVVFGSELSFVVGVTLPIHQTLSQAFTWNDQFYIGTQSLGYSTPYNGSCGLFRITTKGAVTGVLSLANYTSSVGLQGFCSVQSYVFSSNSTVTLLVGNGVGLSASSFQLFEVDLPSFTMTEKGKLFGALYPALVSALNDNQVSWLVDTAGSNAALFSNNFPADIFPPTSSTPLLRFGVSAVFSGISPSSVPAESYIIGVGTHNPPGRGPNVLFNQSLVSGSNATYLPGSTPMAVLTPDGTVVCTSEEATGSSFTTSLNIFPAAQLFPTAPSNVIVAKNSPSRTYGILADDNDIFVFLGSGGPATVSHYQRVATNSYRFVEQVSTGPARLGFDMRSGPLMSATRTFIVASYFTPSDTASVDLYAY